MASKESTTLKTRAMSGISSPARAFGVVSEPVLSFWRARFFAAAQNDTRGRGWAPDHGAYLGREAE